MEKMCRFLIYFILFLVLYQYFYEVVEGHVVQSGKILTDCSTATTRNDCRLKAPSCFWGTNDCPPLDPNGNAYPAGSVCPRRMPSLISGSDGNPPPQPTGACLPTGSNTTASAFHSGNHHGRNFTDTGSIGDTLDPTISTRLAR